MRETLDITHEENELSDKEMSFRKLEIVLCHTSIGRYIVILNFSKYRERMWKDWMPDFSKNKSKLFSN